MLKSDFTTRYTGKVVPIGDGHCAFVPRPLPPNFSCQNESLALIDQAMLSLGELRAVIPQMPNPRLLTFPFSRREAVLSSKIEGTHTELEQLYLFEVDSRSDGGLETRDALEVHNYVVALEHGLAQLTKGALPVCNRLLREMHEKLLDGIPEHHGHYKRPGEFRQEQAFIGSSDISTARYVAPPASEIERLMADLEQYIHSPARYHQVLVRIAIAHYQFEAIHPFVDGNGRIGRLLISLLLASWNVLPEPLLYLSAYFERNVEEYRQRLWHVSCHGDWDGWVQYFLRGVCEVAQDATARAKRALELREKYRQHFQSRRGATSALVLIDSLFISPFITVTHASEILNISYPAARKNINKLIEASILFEYDETVWRKLYFARPILKAIQETALQPAQLPVG